MNDYIECIERPRFPHYPYGPRENFSIHLKHLDEAVPGTLSARDQGEAFENFPVIEFRNDKKVVYRWLFCVGEEDLRDKCLDRISKLIPKKVEAPVIKKQGKKK